MINLSNLKPAEGSRKKKKRIGRGDASGTGGTAGRGHKGQKARSGASIPGWFEGGQMPIYRRLPKRGFKNIFKKEVFVVNVGDLKNYATDGVIDVELIRSKNKIKNDVSIKLLAKGEIDKSVTLKVNAASAAAKEKIEKAGGSVEII